MGARRRLGRTTGSTESAPNNSQDRVRDTVRKLGNATSVGGGVVPPGTLKTSRAHPLAALIPEERERTARRCLGELVLRIIRPRC
jgi:predicted polyphosphate/ATP-dependent NAD kinase